MEKDIFLQELEKYIINALKAGGFEFIDKLPQKNLFTLLNFIRFSDLKDEENKKIYRNMLWENCKYIKMSQTSNALKMSFIEMELQTIIIKCYMDKSLS